ncbi:MAG: hypothetical protein JW986_02445 [Methanotrichaceae archaeon]|nr:hypothetical protein [Methanotrichaceae archaeon]
MSEGREPEAGTGDRLTKDEREKLLSHLQRVLVWVGEKVPDEVEVDRDLLGEELDRDHLGSKDIYPEVHPDSGEIDLHELIWRLIHEEGEVSSKEKAEIQDLIIVLKRKETDDVELLKNADITREEAQRIFAEAAGVIRALLDLKDMLKGNRRSLRAQKAARRTVENARRWNRFMDEVKDRPKYGES